MAGQGRDHLPGLDTVHANRAVGRGRGDHGARVVERHIQHLISVPAASDVSALDARSGNQPQRGEALAVAGIPYLAGAIHRARDNQCRVKAVLHVGDLASVANECVEPP